MNYCFNADSARYVYSNPHQHNNTKNCIANANSGLVYDCLIHQSVCSFLSFLMLFFILQCFWFFIFLHSISLHVRFWNCACHFLPYYPFSTCTFISEKTVHESGSLLSQMNLVRKKITMGMAGVRLNTKFI